MFHCGFALVVDGGQCELTSQGEPGFQPMLGVTSDGHTGNVIVLDDNAVLMVSSVDSQLHVGVRVVSAGASDPQSSSEPFHGTTLHIESSSRVRFTESVMVSSVHISNSSAVEFAASVESAGAVMIDDNSSVRFAARLGLG